MGRSVPSYRLYLDELEADWRQFRRALRREDRAAFDEVMALARRLASASSYQAAEDPMDALLLSIAIEHQKELRAIRRRLDGGTLDGAGQRKGEGEDSESTLDATADEREAEEDENAEEGKVVSGEGKTGGESR